MSLLASPTMHLSPVVLVASLSAYVLAAPYVYDTKKGVSYQGFVASPGIESFHGIPYGKDTSGASRFAPPRAFEPPTNYTYNATAFGASCPQPLVAGAYSDNVTYQSEDCLNLNVVRPAQNGSLSTQLPVMVYIYGYVTSNRQFGRMLRKKKRKSFSGYRE